MIVGGLDVGTTGCKLTSYDDNGNYIYNSYVSSAEVNEIVKRVIASIKN